jgi:hypothetical protein
VPKVHIHCTTRARAHTHTHTHTHTWHTHILSLSHTHAHGTQTRTTSHYEYSIKIKILCFIYLLSMIYACNIDTSFIVHMHSCRMLRDSLQLPSMVHSPSVKKKVASQSYPGLTVEVRLCFCKHEMCTSTDRHTHTTTTTTNIRL